MIVAFAGGVGGARLARGLAQIAGDRLAVIVNTGDDFEHLGLRICPDIDTVTYTLAGIANPATGWGIAGETWGFMEQVRQLGGADWFQLGDRDIALHVLRTARLREGARLTEVTGDVAQRLGIAARILPMTDQPVMTQVRAATGWLDFQDYFVRRRCEDAISAIRFHGIERARPTVEVREALAAARVLVLCPSNPFVSIDPILAVPGLRDALAARRVPCVAVSPIVGGKAVKGPAAKMMTELGLVPSSAAIATRYRGLIDALVIDRQDAAEHAAVSATGVAVEVADTLMPTLEDSVRVARTALDVAARLPAR
jgi:LPPG:FO 2-phospho-L-lactate transferase